MHRLRTLGGLVLLDEADERVEALTGRTRALALLAYLAVEGAGERVAREELVGLFWPDRSEERARKALRSTLYQIRRATEAPLVGGKGEQSLWVEGGRLAVDVAAFREAVEAGEHARILELYEGPFLAGVHVSDAPRFERWVDRGRGEVRQQAYEAALALGREARSGGDLAAAEEAFRRALDLAPLREEPARALIRTLAERGRPADAVLLFEAFRERREEELDLAPSDEMTEEVEALKRAPPAGAGPPEGRPSDPEAGSGTPDAGEGPSAAGASARDAARRPVLGVLAALVLLAGAGLGGWALLTNGEDPVATPEHTLAVLPFTSIGTGQPDPIAEGLHSDLLTRLSGVGALRVTSGTSVERLRETDLSLPAIADSLGVRWIVEGTVHRAGDSIAVNAQLIDPVTDTHAWARSYRRGLTAESLFGLLGDITRRITRALEGQVTRAQEERLVRQSTGSLAAHRFYVRGRSLLEQREVPQMRRALAYFDQALTEDSGYALAWAGRANGLSVLARYPGADPDTLLPRADSAVRRALALEPDLAEAHLARGRLHMYRREGPAALRDFQRAIELKPSFAAAHAWLGKLLLSLGRPDAAVEASRRSVELDPMSTENQGTLSLALLAVGRSGEALRVAHRIEELLGDDDFFPVYEIHARMEMGQLDELERIADELGRSGPRAPWVAWLRASTGGDTVPAARALRELETEGRTVTRILLHTSLGHFDRAFELIEATYPRRDVPWDLSYTVNVRYLSRVTLDTLRADPRFDAFLAEMNRTWGLEADGSLPEGIDVPFDALDEG